MTEDEKLLARKLESIFSGQSFYDWYISGRYYAYISGTSKEEEKVPSKDEILEDITQMIYNVRWIK